MLQCSQTMAFDQLTFRNDGINGDIKDNEFTYDRSRDPPGRSRAYFPPDENGFYSERYRLNTFVNFPKHAPVQPALLAKHGFYYTRYKDEVTCFSCNVKVGGWCVGDDVTLSRFHFPGCKLVMGTEQTNKPILGQQPQFGGEFLYGKISEPTSTSGPKRKKVKPLIQMSTNLKDQSRKNAINRSLRLGTESTSVEQPIQARNSAELSKSQAGLMGERNRQFPCLFPINPHMQHYESRVATFDHNWRRFNIKASINDIARAGFYFLGVRDRAKCWYCNGGLQNWEPNDEPFMEHAKWFPGCEFILNQKGFDFVKDVASKFANLVRPPLRYSRFDLNSMQLVPVTYPKQTRPVNTDAVIAHKAIEMGFPEDKVKMIIDRFQNKKAKFKNAEELIDALLPDNGQTAGCSNVPSTSQSNNNISKTKNQQTPGVEEERNAANDLQKELKESERCKICQRKKAECVVLPCCHFPFCAQCANDSTRCPVCKNQIGSKIIVNFET